MLLNGTEQDSNNLRLSSILLCRVAIGLGGNCGIDTGWDFVEVKSSGTGEVESSTGGPVVGSGGGTPSKSTSLKFSSALYSCLESNFFKVICCFSSDQLLGNSSPSGGSLEKVGGIYWWRTSVGELSIVPELGEQVSGPEVPEINEKNDKH